MKSILRRAGLGLAIAACFSMAALAGTSDRTRIDVRTKYDTVETVVVQDLAPGEVRSLSTATGNPALVTRTDKGIKLELAGETFDVALPDPEHMDGAELPAGAKVIRIEKHAHDEVADGADGKVQHRTIVKRHELKGASDGAEVELELHEGDADLALAEAHEPGPLAEGQRIRVIRELRREEQQVSK